MLSKYTYSSALFKKSFPHTATGSSCLLRAVKKRQHPKMLLSVRAKGLEPIRTRHQILSLACLPISTRPLAEGKGRKKATDFKTILTPASLELSKPLHNLHHSHSNLHHLLFRPLSRTSRLSVYSAPTRRSGRRSGCRTQSPSRRTETQNSLSDCLSWRYRCSPSPRRPLPPS